MNNKTANNLSGQDIKDEVLQTGKNVARTTIVWTLASLATGFLRDIIKTGISKVNRPKVDKPDW